MSATSIEPEPKELGELMRHRLTGFARTLRANGFKVGLAETRDGLAILTLPVARRPASLKSAQRALFCATHSDWERFDEIFDAYWLGRGRRQVQALVGATANNHLPLRRLGEAGAQQGDTGLPDHVRRSHDDDGNTNSNGRGRREGASRFENLANVDLRHIVDPANVARANQLASRLARVMRARLVRRERIRRRGRRLDLRRTIHRNVSHGGTPIELA